MENETKEVRIYKVFDRNMETLTQRISKLNKRATKLGCEPVVVTEVGTELFKQIEVDRFSDPEYDVARSLYFVPADHKLVNNEVFTGVATIRHNLTVDGATPKLAGWEFIGKIEVVKDEDNKVIGNLLRLIPDAVAPASYRDVAPWCDHCNVQRHWAETFLIKHDDGTFKQVGRNCIADFLGGVDPEAIMGRAEWLLSLDSMMSGAEDEDWLGGGGHGGKTFYDIETLLTMTACHIRLDGWMSGTKARQFEVASTRDNIMSQLNARTKTMRDVWAKHVPSDEDKKTAEDTVEWLSNLPISTDNEYRYSLALLGRAGSVNFGQTGLLCSAISTCLRDREVEVARAASRESHKNSTFIGTIKQRLVFNTLVIESVRYIPTDFGGSYLYTFADPTGNVIKWFASNELQLGDGSYNVNSMIDAIGKIVSLKGTITKHEEYNGVKATYINRAVIV
jgi:hypothetical protein